MRLMACLLVLLLSGCTGPTDGSSKTTGLDGAPAGADPQAAPEPVEVRERIDLTQGLDEAEWEVQVAPGYTDGRVVARIEGPQDTSLLHTAGFCYGFEGRQDDGSTYSTRGGSGCGSSAVGMTMSSQQEFVRLEGKDFGSGWYRFTFSAEPTLGVLVVEMVADYGQGASGADQSAHA